VAIVLALVCCRPSAAQEQDRGRRGGWDPAEFFKRLDANGSAHLEPDELRGNARKLVESLGFDASQPVPINHLLEKIGTERREAAAERATRKAAAGRKTPGFGNADESSQKLPGFGRDKPTASVPRFGETASATTAGTEPSWQDEFEEQIVQRVNRLLRRYDRNDNGVIDGAEKENVPWDPPNADEFDADHNGELNPAEIARRYVAMQNGGSGNDNGGDRKSRSRRFAESRRDASRDNNASRQLGNDDNASSAGTERPTASITPAPRRSADDRSRRYADDLLKKYDKDGDWKLDGEELADVKLPLKSADHDGDGKVTRDEIVSFISGGRPAEPAGATPPRGRGGSASPNLGEAPGGPNRIVRDGPAWSRFGASGGRRTPPDRSTERPSGRFDDLDQNRDGQIQMHEFSSQWDEKTIRQFAEIDRNGDGVLTPKEFADRAP
jgi:Ca2+-binding EF-hand superfamily protein